MKKKMIEALTVVMGQLYSMESDEDVEMLLKTVYGLYFSGKIGGKELHWIVKDIQSITQNLNLIDTREKVSKEIAEQTILWLRMSAAEAEAASEIMGVAIYHAAEYLQDYWSEIIE